METLYRHLSITAILTFGLFATALYLAHEDFYSDLPLIVFSAGTVGAVVNNYFRVTKISTNPDPVQKDLGNLNVKIQFYISPLISGILAIVAHGLFYSGILAGELFPEFTEPKPYDGVASFLTEQTPRNTDDAVKLIFWGFVAGFSEKFIPNIIDSLVSRATNEQKDT